MTGMHNSRLLKVFSTYFFLLLQISDVSTLLEAVCPGFRLSPPLPGQESSVEPGEVAGLPQERAVGEEGGEWVSLGPGEQASLQNLCLRSSVDIYQTCHLLRILRGPCRAPHVAVQVTEYSHVHQCELGYLLGPFVPLQVHT